MRARVLASLLAWSLVFSSASLVPASAQVARVASDVVHLPRSYGPLPVRDFEQLGGAEFAPDGRTVVYWRRRGVYGFALFAAPVEGGTVVPVASGEADGAGPRVLVGAAYVVYRALDPSGVLHLFSAPLDGGAAPVQLDTHADDVNVSDVVLTPDGSRVVYTSSRSGTSYRLDAIRSVPVSGGTVTTLAAAGPGDPDIRPRFEVTSDGTRVVFEILSRGLYSVPVEGGPVATLYSGGPLWTVSADGSVVVIVALKDTSDFSRMPGDLFTVPAGGGPLTLVGAVSYSGYDPPLVSRDGTLAVYHGTPGVVAQPLPSGASTLLHAGDPAAIGLAPDAAHVFVVADGALTLVPTDGGPESVVASPPQPDAANMFDLSRFTPDGGTLLYQLLVGSSGPLPESDAEFAPELWAAPVNGGPAVHLATGSTSIGPGALRFSVTPDSQRVVAETATGLRSVLVADGAATELPRYEHRLSRDGTRVVAMETRLRVVPVTGGAPVAIDLDDVPTEAAAFVPAGPTRIFDSRVGEPAPGPKGFVRAGERVDVQIAGIADVPADATAAVVNLTATDAAAAGFVTAWPAGTERPLASNLNLTSRGQTRAVMAVVPLGSGGDLSLYTQSGAHLIVDLLGYFAPAGGASRRGRVVALTPERILDTRPEEAAAGPKGKLRPGDEIEVVVAGRAGIPDDAVAVVVNVTATDVVQPGYVTAWPAGSARPLTSTVNVDASGGTAANLAIVALGSGGRLALRTHAGGHLVADVFGYVTSDAAPLDRTGLFVPIAPQRVLDTRDDGGVALAPGDAVSVWASATADASALVLTVTATEAATGFVTVAPFGLPLPLVSNLNLEGPGDTRAAAVIINNLWPWAGVHVLTQSEAHLVVDASGYFLV